MTLILENFWNDDTDVTLCEDLGAFGMHIVVDDLLDVDVEEEDDDSHIAAAMLLAGCTEEQVKTALEVLHDPDHWISRVDERLPH